MAREYNVVNVYQGSTVDPANFALGASFNGQACANGPPATASTPPTTRSRSVRQTASITATASSTSSRRPASRGRRAEHDRHVLCDRVNDNTVRLVATPTQATTRPGASSTRPSRRARSGQITRRSRSPATASRTTATSPITRRRPRRSTPGRSTSPVARLAGHLRARSQTRLAPATSCSSTRPRAIWSALASATATSSSTGHQCQRRRRHADQRADQRRHLPCGHERVPRIIELKYNSARFRAGRLRPQLVRRSDHPPRRVELDRQRLRRRAEAVHLGHLGIQRHLRDRLRRRHQQRHADAVRQQLRSRAPPALPITSPRRRSLAPM